MRFLSAPEGIGQAAGHGLFEFALLLLHKIHAKQKEQHPIRCCSWCDRENSNLWPSRSEYYGQEATVTLLDAKDEGVQTFEQAKDSLKGFYARQKLRNTEPDSVKSR